MDKGAAKIRSLKPDDPRRAEGYTAEMIYRDKDDGQVKVFANLKNFTLTTKPDTYV